MHAPSGIAERKAFFAAGELLFADLPDWRDSVAYDWLNQADPSFLIWEWLRRDPDYRQEALSHPPQTHPSPFAIIEEQRPASKWGLHAFEDPRRSSDARPLWLSSHDRSVLRARAIEPHRERGIFSLEELGAMATVGVADEECRVLLCHGLRALRIDVEGRDILRTPVSLQFQICGFEAARQPVRTWARLKHLIKENSLPPLPVRALTARRRQLLLLRAFDALRAGASQRQIAAELLRRDAAMKRWRSVTPSLRSQAQRLVKGARMHAQGRFWSILE